MKKIIPVLIVGLFILGGLNVVAINIGLESNISKIQIVQITNSEQIGEELKIFTTTYKQNTKNDIDNIEIEKQHELIKNPNNFDSFDYVIITTESLYNSITSSAFIGWKTLLGFNIKMVNITDAEISSQSGQDLPEKIRNFLREYYQTWGINYVLIVGDHETIPMRYCYPDPTNHRFDVFDYTSGEVPTDYYYADLSSSDADSWDSDHDGYHGEYGDDLPDFKPEVYVGRIPTNVGSRITYSLDKIVTFEQDTDDWKQNALHAGAFFYFTNEDHSGNPVMDGAKLSYYIEKDIMSNWTISHYSEQAGIEKSVYDWPSLTETAFIDDWRTGKYSVMNWQGHGWTNGVARKVWSSDDGDEVPEYDEISWPYFITMSSNLDDDYPSVVTAESCYVGCPEPASGGNLGIDLLTNPSMGASIGVVASSRSPYGSFDWPNTPGGSDSIIYEFNNLLINYSNGVGEAIYESKYYCNFNYGWAHYAEYIDMFAFNLFGDPSLLIEGINLENNPPDKPTIDGPNKGNPGNEYTYCIIASDPDGDVLNVKWDWSDGTYSDWMGPYDSGTEVCDSHIWETQGSYFVRVTVEDEHGMIESATLEVEIPRSRAINNYFQLFFERFPNTYLVLRFLL